MARGSHWSLCENLTATVWASLFFWVSVLLFSLRVIPFKGIEMKWHLLYHFLLLYWHFNCENRNFEFGSLDLDFFPFLTEGELKLSFINLCSASDLEERIGTISPSCELLHTEHSLGWRERVSVGGKWEDVLQPLFSTRWCRVSQFGCQESSRGSQALSIGAVTTPAQVSPFCWTFK